MDTDADRGNPVAHGFIDGVFEGATAGERGHDLSTEEFHAEDIESLALYVDFAHVNHALHAHERRSGG
jgi:hypothetical protein